MSDRHGASLRRAAIVALLIVPCVAGRTSAQTSSQASRRAGDPPAGAPTADPYASDLDAAVSEVVVTGLRTPPGSVVGDIKPELTLSPSDIQSYGVSTLTELLGELAPETRSDRGRSNSAPVVLLGGRRISGFQEIRDIPVEAIQRVEVLPEEVALKYGYTADQRVVNVVLRRFFRAWTAEGGVGGATEGGLASASGEADLFHVFRDQRLNLDLKVNGSSGLKEDDRDLVSTSAGQLFDLNGNVTSAMPGGVIDVRLSPTAVVAGVPASAGLRPLTLADFAGTAGIANATDVRPYRSLVPEKESVALNAVLARPMLFGFNGTINGTLEANRTYSVQGLPGYALDVPAGDPFSPFAQDVLLSRYAGGYGALSQEVRTWTAHLGAGATRDLAKWHLTFIGAYDHGDTETLSDTGVDAGAAQAQLDARSAAFDPFGPIPTDALTRLGRSEASQITDSANLQGLATGALLNAPAGQLYASFKAGDSPSFLSSSSTRGLLRQDVDLSRNDFNAQANLDLPLASRSRGVLPWLGALSVSGNVAIDAVSDAGSLLTYGEGINWTPVTGWTVIVSHTHDENAPTVQQLGAPAVSTTGVRVFDYVTGRTVDVTSLSGGNPSLVADSREVTKIGLTFKPVSTQDLTLQANWIRERIDNPVESFPAVTAEIAAAFPDRFVRDGSGELVSIDNRPVNFARSDREELRYGFNYSRPLGPQPRRPEFGRRRRRDETEDQKRRVAAQSGQDMPPPGPPDDGGPPPGGFGGRGGGGFGRGGFGGSPRGGSGPGGRLQFALYHTVVFTDQLLVRPGGPVLDLLNGSAAGSTGGTPQHEIEAQAGFSVKGFGARLSADWKSGTTVRGASTLGDLAFSNLATVNLRLFDDFTQQAWALKTLPWLRGARLTVGVTNLFDERIRVADASGVTPIGYQPAYLDPTGRTIRVQFRKLFFTPPSAGDRERMRSLFGRNDNGAPAIPPP